MLWYHSHALASKSKYIDTMLSTSMKEKDDKLITFPDISKTTWDEMMKFLECPIATRQMGATDVIKIAILYDKYEFTDGSKLCDQVLIDYFDSAEKQEQDLSLDIDVIIDSVVIALEANLEAAYRQGMRYIWKSMKSFTQTPYGRTMFTEDQIRKLVPALQHFRSSEYEDIRKYGGLGLLERVELPSFPQQFVSKGCSLYNNWLLQQCISHIELSGTHCNADGKFDINSCLSSFNYTSDRQARWDGEMMTFSIERQTSEEFDGWAIIRSTIVQNDEDGDPDYDTIVDKLCWVAPGSRNHFFPPRASNCWKSFDPLATGSPKIKFILNEEI